MILLEDPVWFSPLTIIHHVSELGKHLTPEEKLSKNFRKVTEANMTAIMLTGLMTINKKQYWMQLVDDKYGSPDIRTLCYASEQPEKFDNMEYQDVEVVEYEDHSHESIPEFLAKTKFSLGKAYDKDIHILCYVGGTATVKLSDRDTLKRQMSIINSPCPIVFLGATSVQGNRYRLIQLNPNVVSLIEFDLKDELFKLGRNGHIGVLNLKRGIKRPLQKNPDEKYYPFEKIGYIPDNSGKYSTSSIAKID